MDRPPVPLPFVKSPPWSMSWGITRWKTDPSYPNPCWPVASSRKFFAVRGTILSYNLKTIRPAACEFIEMSNYTKQRSDEGHTDPENTRTNT